jgi:flagellar hook-associated protein 2
MAAAISSTGSGGVDVNAIVTALMAVERLPIKKLDTKETSENAKISAYGLVKSQVASFQATLTSLGSTTSSKFSAFKATSSDATTLSGTADTTAAAGIYTLNVTTLAQSQKLVAAGKTSKTTAISDGAATVITFDLGTISGGTLTAGVYTGATYTSGGTVIAPITIDGTNNTLEGIRTAINAANIGVTASIVNDGSGTPYRLALSSNSSGVANSIKITTSGGDGTINTLLAHDPGGLPAAQHLNQTVAAQNAVFDVNGISVSKASNTVTDAVEGVALTLSKVTTVPVTLTVARDTTAVTDAATAFVKSFNDMYNGIKNATAFNSKSALEGDSTLRSFMSQLRAIVTGEVTGGTLTSLYQAGITSNIDGTLTLDSSTLSSAMATNFSDVAHLFNSATGFATAFDALATTTLGAGGTIPARITSFQSNISRIGVERTSLEARMKTIEANYRAQFSNLNMLLASLNSTSSYLSLQ